MGFKSDKDREAFIQELSTAGFSPDEINQHISNIEKSAPAPAPVAPPIKPSSQMGGGTADATVAPPLAPPAPRPVLLVDVIHQPVPSARRTASGRGGTTTPVEGQTDLSSAGGWCGTKLSRHPQTHRGRRRGACLSTTRSPPRVVSPRTAPPEKWAASCSSGAGTRTWMTRQASCQAPR